MGAVAGALVALVAVLHLGFLTVEMLLWRRPIGRRIFATTRENAEITAVMAANQGLYNGFLAAGLIVGLVVGDPTGFAFRVFSLVCVIVAGAYGAATVSRKILLVQALPAAVALVAVVLAH